MECESQKKDRLDGATSRRSEKGEKELKSQEGRAFIILVTLPSLLGLTRLANFLPALTLFNKEQRKNNYQIITIP